MLPRVYSRFKRKTHGDVPENLKPADMFAQTRKGKSSMKISSRSYQISIERIQEPLKCESLKRFDYVFDPCVHITDEFHSTFSVKVEKKSQTFSIALIGSFFAFDSQCAALDGSTLTVLMDDEIFVLDLESISLIRHKAIGNESYFAIYPIENGYIIHGEQTILRLNRNFEQVWRFGGSDIFVTQNNGEGSFAIADDRIYLEDWNGYKFILDLDGKLLLETQLQ